MKKITKKEFIELLVNNSSKFIGRLDSETVYNEEIAEEVNKEHDISKVPVRSVDVKQTNAIRFTGGSWLYFDQKGKQLYYRENDFIWQEHCLPEDENCERKNKYIYLVYKVLIAKVKEQKKS